MSPEQVAGANWTRAPICFRLEPCSTRWRPATLPFHGESSAVICEAIMNRAPVPAVRLNPDLPAKLEDIINKALEKDSNLRYQHASEMRSDLQRLKRDTESGRSQLLGANRWSAAGVAARSKFRPAQRDRPRAARPRSPRRRRSSRNHRKDCAGRCRGCGCCAGRFSSESRRQAAPAASSGRRIKTVAVLPLQNLGADKDLDFLRLALADEIATSLSYVRSLTIRPFATTSKYDSPTLDLQEAGHAMHVTDVVTGHFMKEGSQLQITLEAIDVANNRTVWRDTMTVAAPDMIAMRSEITAKVRQGLVPALGAGTDSRQGATRPKNEEAYDLYLRSIALPHDPQPNKDAIAMLERAVGMDPTYAPAWAISGISLPLRWSLFERRRRDVQAVDAALERALALDPNLISAAMHG